MPTEQPLHCVDDGCSSPDLTASLGDARLVIALADVGQGASLGGAESVNSGRTIRKNFDVATRIAAQAVLDIVSGTAIATGNANDGCEVTPSGSCTNVDSENCFFVLFAGLLDERRITIFEQAASVVESRVNLRSDVGRAACAVIKCTFEGGGPASPECMDGAFP